MFAYFWDNPCITLFAPSVFISLIGKGSTVYSLPFNILLKYQNIRFKPYCEIHKN